jgi:hypothetical protein
MTTRLSEEQRQALERQPAGPVYVVDEITRSSYVLLSAAAYQRVRALLEADPFDVAEMGPLIEQVTSKEGWDDPEMSAYDALDPRRPPQAP